MRGIEGEVGARASARPGGRAGRRAARRGTAAARTSGPERSADRLDRAARRGGEPGAGREATGHEQRESQQGDRPARHQVAGDADVALGAVLDRSRATRPGRGSGRARRGRSGRRCRCRRTRACPRPDSTGSSPSAESRTAGSPASISGPCSPSPAGSASRKRSSSGPSSPAGVASSLETVELAVSASWLAVLCGPVDQGITSGAVGILEGRLAQHDGGVEQAGVAVVADEPLGAEGADARAVGGDEDQGLAVGGPGEARRRSRAAPPSTRRWSSRPLPRATSRGAISAIWRFDSPGQGRDQVAQVDVVAVEGAIEASARRRPRPRSPRSGSSPARRACRPPPSPGSGREPTRRAPWRAAPRSPGRRRPAESRGQAPRRPPGARTSRSRRPGGPRAARILYRRKSIISRA